MVGGAAADDVETMDIPDGLLVKGQLGQVDLAVLELVGGFIDANILRINALHTKAAGAEHTLGMAVITRAGAANARP